MEKNDSNLPVVVNQQKSILNIEKKHPRLISNLKRIGKITGYTAGALGFVVLAGAGSLATIPAITAVANTVGLVGTIGTLYKAGTNVVYRNEKDLLFNSRRELNGELRFFQRADTFNKVKGLSNIQLAGLMTLNTLVGLERYKSIINNSKYEIDNNQKIYNQKFVTKTHQININNFKILEQMGYIKIDDISEKKGETSLLVEKIGMGNKSGLKNYFKALISGDKEEIKKNKVDMHDVRFRLTDKKIDLVELYGNFAKLPKKERFQDRIGYVLFDSKRGILGDESKADKKIGIYYDSLGRPYIDYNAKESGVETFSKIIKPQEIQKTKQQIFREQQHVEIKNPVLMQEKNNDDIIRENTTYSKEGEER